MLREKIASDINKMALIKAAAGDDFRYLGPSDKTKNWLASRTADINGAMDSLGAGAARARDYVGGGLSSARDYVGDRVADVQNYFSNDLDGDAMGAAEGAGRFVGEYGPIAGDAAEMSARQVGDAGTFASDEAQMRAFLTRQELDRLRQRITEPVEEALRNATGRGRDAMDSISDGAGRAAGYVRDLGSKGYDFVDRMGSSFSQGMGADDTADQLAFQKARRAGILKNMDDSVNSRHQIVGILEAIRNMDSDVRSEEASAARRGRAMQAADAAVAGNIRNQNEEVAAANRAFQEGAALRQREQGSAAVDKALRSELEDINSPESLATDTMANIGESMQGGLSGLMEGIKADPNASAALAAGAGGLGAAGILRLIKLLRGRGSAPAPI